MHCPAWGNAQFSSYRLGCHKATNCRYYICSQVENQHFCNSLHQFTCNLAQPMGTWVCLAVQNYTPIGARRWERDPKMAKISTFRKESPHRGEPFH